jgi:hypothetical protein
MTSDSELLSRLSRAERQAFAEVYDTFSPCLYRYAYRLLGDAETVEDLLAAFVERGLVAFTPALSSPKETPEGGGEKGGRARQHTLLRAYALALLRRANEEETARHLHARNQINRHPTYDVYHARPEDCATCPLRWRCLSQPSASRRLRARSPFSKRISDLRCRPVTAWASSSRRLRSLRPCACQYRSRTLCKYLRHSSTVMGSVSAISFTPVTFSFE